MIITTTKRKDRAWRLLYDVYAQGELYKVVSFATLHTVNILEPFLTEDFKQSGLVLYVPFYVDSFPVIPQSNKA